MQADVALTARLVVSDALTALRAPMMSRRFQRAAANAAAPVKVNVGAGTVMLPGWLNTDVMWRGEMYLDLTRPWPVPPESIDRIYADNVIEHFSLEKARDVLRYCYQALRPGGAIRLATPDLERTVRAYLEDPELTAAHLDRHRRHGYPAEYPADMLRVTYAYHGHHRATSSTGPRCPPNSPRPGSATFAVTTPGTAMTPNSRDSRHGRNPPRR